MASPIPLQSLYTLFNSASSAALRAQAYLDSRSAEGPHAWYAIPQVGVKSKFGLTRDSSGIINVILGRAGKQEFTHELQFSLIATPKPDVKSMPAQPGPDDILVSEPAFLVNPSERQALASIVLDALSGRRPYDGRYADDPGEEDFTDEVTAFNDTLTSQKEESVVFLRLSRTPPRYLVVRIDAGGISGGHDGIYVVQPEAAVPVFIYDFLGSEQNAIWYEPFAMLTAALREWFSAGLAGVPMQTAEVPSFDQISFSEIARGLWSSYKDAGGASGRAPGLPGAPETAYSLRDVGAALTYAVPPNDDQQATSYIQSRLNLQVDARSGQPKVRGQLLAPEFVLVEDARRQFLDDLRERVSAAEPCHNILNADAAYAADYCAAFRDRRREQDALVFLSYRKQPARNQFLVVWTGRIGGDDRQEERDFAFTCSMGSSGLEAFRIVLKLEDPVAGSITGRQHPFTEAQLSRKNYVGFHNFIHAVRIWDMRVGWFTPKKEAP